MPEGHAARGDMMTVNISALLRFFDEVPDDSRRHATSIVSVVGEELGLALLVDYLSKTDAGARLLKEPCKTGKKRGSRLDGWVETTSTLYQVEVKSWSAHSFGGTPLRIDASPEELPAFRVARWNENWRNGTFADPPAAKVLERMPPPHPHSNIEPLIVFWVAMNPDGKADPFFRVALEGERFPVLNVFSVSGYLRQIPEDTLELSLPNTRTRMRWLSEMFITK